MKSSVLMLIALVTFVSHTSFAGLRVHEWGTFTSVQGSDGETLSGLEYEEEALPSFVHNRDSIIESHKPSEALAVGVHCPPGCKRCCKGDCCDSLRGALEQPLLVTQKMETPVLYFYSPVPTKVDVTVDFPKGIISQYYPKPTGVLPVSNGTQSLQGGQIHYSKLEVLASPAEVPPVVAGNVYGPARGTSSNYVRSEDETEKFIFYRGLGNFKTALKITSDANQLTLRDTLGKGIPYMLALNIRNGKGSFKELGNLLANGQSGFSMNSFNKELTPTEDLKLFENRVSPILIAALEKSGLYHEEAQSMVNTWRLSYFHTDGLRVLYILPRAETDGILPLKITPTPEETVRTLVGRIEVMTKSEEDTLLAALAKSETLQLGRFTEPKLLRLKQLEH